MIANGPILCGRGFLRTAGADTADHRALRVDYPGSRTQRQRRSPGARGCHGRQTARFSPTIIAITSACIWDRHTRVPYHARAMTRICPPSLSAFTTPLMSFQVLSTSLSASYALTLRPNLEDRLFGRISQMARPRLRTTAPVFLHRHLALASRCGLGALSLGGRRGAGTLAHAASQQAEIEHRSNFTRGGMRRSFLRQRRDAQLRACFC